MTLKNLSVRIDEDCLKKLKYVAEYEGRSLNRHVLILIRKNIEEFERKIEKIEVNS